MGVKTGHDCILGCPPHRCTAREERAWARRVLPDFTAGPASQAIGARVREMTRNEPCWYCCDGRAKCGACGRGWR